VVTIRWKRNLSLLSTYKRFIAMAVSLEYLVSTMPFWKAFSRSKAEKPDEERWERHENDPEQPDERE
jgi:hypothetical protein